MGRYPQPGEPAYNGTGRNRVRKHLSWERVEKHPSDAAAAQEKKTEQKAACRQVGTS